MLLREAKKILNKNGYLIFENDINIYQNDIDSFNELLLKYNIDSWADDDSNILKTTIDDDLIKYDTEFHVTSGKYEGIYDISIIVNKQHNIENIILDDFSINGDLITFIKQFKKFI